jgi:hypothetical protein
VSEPTLSGGPPSANWWRLWSAAVVLLYLGVQALWVTATPLERITLPDNLPPGYPSVASSQTVLVGTGPDEKEHFLYLLSLAERGALPWPSPAYRTSPDQFVSYQAQHPPLFYLLGALLYRAIPADQRPGAAGPFWYALRWLCALFGAGVVLFAGAAARIAFPERPLVAWGTIAVAAFTPMFGHMMGCLSNEPLAMLFAAWAWWMTVGLLRSDRSPTVRDGAMLGLALGLAGETRLTALIWVPAVVVALAVAGRRNGGSVAAIGVFAGVCLLLVAPWFVHNQLAYGTPFYRTFDRPTLYGGATFGDYWAGAAPVPPDVPILITPRLTILYYAATAWTPYWLLRFYLQGPPGWNGPIFWQLIAVLVDAVAFLLLVMHAVHAREASRAVARSRASVGAVAGDSRETPSTTPDPAGRVILWATGLTLAVCLAGTFEQQIYSDWTVVLSPGRYLVAATSASALLFAFALSTVGERRHKIGTAAPRANGAGRALVAPVLLAALLFAFDLASAGLVRRFYSDNPVQPSVQNVPRTSYSTDSP